MTEECNVSNTAVGMEMPVGSFLDAISVFKDERQGILDEILPKRPPTDFISPHDWSIYVKICCHLRHWNRLPPNTDDPQGKNCLIRMVSAFNRLYTEYSLLCEAAEKVRDEYDKCLNQEKANEIIKNHSLTKRRDKGDIGQSQEFETLVGQSEDFNCAYRGTAEKLPSGCCMPIERRKSKVLKNSGDIFDCIQRHPPESSIWVKQLRVDTSQAMLTTKYKVEQNGRSKMESVRLPIALELTLPRIQRKVQSVMTACPYIHDPLEVVAELRATNYNDEVCVKYFDKTKYLREVIQEFLPTRTLRPINHQAFFQSAIDSPAEWLDNSPRLLGMTEQELEDFLLHYEQRLQAMRKVQKEATRRVQCLHAFSSGLVSVMEQVFMERDSQRKSILQEGAQERYRNLTSRLSSLKEENILLRETLMKQEERRRLTFNMIQEYLGNIRVFCRVRAIPQTGRILEVNPCDTVCLNVSPVAEEYKFDRAFDANTSQAEIYAELTPLISSFMDGFNVSFMTYGGESSGKTYTLMGGMDGTTESQGIAYRAMKTVLQEKAIRRTEWDIALKVGVVEIYNETVSDLIGGEAGIHMRVDSGADKMLDSLHTVDLNSDAQIDEILRLCNEKRKVARTALNEASSRSHLIILVRAHSMSNIYQKAVTSVLAMCDLAGFEDIIKADTMKNQVLAKEAGFINRSLTALNRVLTSLKTQSPMSVSYRDSKLTYLLKPFFTNSGKCILIVTVRTDKSTLPSTQGTLRFGRDSRAVSLGRARRQLSVEKLIQDVGTI
ncbi:hypothetical protein Aperf_G00000018090 [Anoplocephala perfoliata]